MQNQLESLLEEAHIKLSSLVSDLLGASARRMLKALAEGETNPAALAALADQRLRATPEQLCDALGACTDLKPVYRRLLKMALEQLQFIEQQIGQLDQEMASLLSQHQDAVAAAGGGARSGSGFGAADHCRSRSHRSDLSLRETSLLVGGRMPRRRRERGRELQPPVSEGQPPHAARSQSGGQRRSQGQRKHLRDCLSPLGPAPGTQSNHRGDCPSTVSADLDDSAPGSPLRRTRPGRHQTIEAKAHCKNDPATPKPRLSDRTTESSTTPVRHKRSDFRPCR